MKARSKLSLAALVAAASLATAVSTAGARRIEFSENHIRAVWTAAERARFIDAGGTYAIECQLTVEGSFHSRTLSKVSGQLIGFITVAEAPLTCFAGGEIAILNGVEPLPGGEAAPNTLPWHIRYDSFRGALPRIEGIRIQIIDASILYWKNLAPQCLYRSTTAKPLFAILEVIEGRIAAMRWEETFSFPLAVQLELEFCPSGAKLQKRSTDFTIQRATTRVFVRLVQ
jgi:hypothetical protein